MTCCSSCASSTIVSPGGGSFTLATTTPSRSHGRPGVRLGIHRPPLEHHDGTRGKGAGHRVSLDDGDAAFEPPGVDVIALDVALQRLAAVYPRQARLVELRSSVG
jgi:hypothetical protein